MSYEREITKKQKGEIGQNLITCFARVNENAQPILFKAISNHLEENFFEKIKETDLFSLQIRSSREDSEYGITQGYRSPRDGKRNYWLADATVVVSFTPEPDEEPKFIEYPIEIKTGPRANFQRDQRKCFIEYHENEPGIPLLICLEIDKLPEKYEMAVKRYVPEQDQIKSYKNEDLEKPSDTFYEKLVE